ncbi:MAG: hypothetical protein JSW39_26060, partial [Desulfobacterales bacterium]
VRRVGFLSLWLAALSPVQILAIRLLRDVFFTHGASVGFYPTLTYTFISLVPYCLLVGFVLPYSLFVLRVQTPGFPGARIYITDNIGDVCGGALFSFVLVFLLTPLQALLIANLPLLAAVHFLFPAKNRWHSSVLTASGLALLIVLAAAWLEPFSLVPSEGNLALYRESRYGRIEVHRNQEQYTLFQDGRPISSSQNLVLAEEAIHYPLSQVDRLEHILIIVAQSGMMAELEKYPWESVDYVELDPELTTVQFQFGLIEKIPGIHVMHRDGRAYLAETDKMYDAIILNLPEPETFQINRFFTDRFFDLAKRHLTAQGVLSFTVEGFDNYLAEPQRQKISSLYNTVKDHFNYVAMLPGQNIFFLCRQRPITTDIPAALAAKGISTQYISRYFYGNLTNERIEYLNELVDPATPKNIDTAPFLMRVMFSQWFAKYATSPMTFIWVIVGSTLVYLLRITREEFVLFTTGCMVMGCEILVIFAFQIYFGYIYLQIGLIITIFLAGLLPGAWLGIKLRHQGRQVLALTDGVLIALMGALLLALRHGGDRLPAAFFLIFGFAVSLSCGFQFPVALRLRGEDNIAATHVFSADLIGAAGGALITSLVLIPYLGILWATAVLLSLKLASLIIAGIHHGNSIPKTFSLW